MFCVCVRRLCGLKLALCSCAKTSMSSSLFCRYFHPLWGLSHRGCIQFQRQGKKKPDEFGEEWREPRVRPPQHQAVTNLDHEGAQVDPSSGPALLDHSQETDYSRAAAERGCKKSGFRRETERKVSGVHAVCSRRYGPSSRASDFQLDSDRLQ